MWLTEIHARLSLSENAQSNKDNTYVDSFSGEAVFIHANIQTLTASKTWKMQGSILLFHVIWDIQFEEKIYDTEGLSDLESYHSDHYALNYLIA